MEINEVKKEIRNGGMNEKPSNGITEKPSTETSEKPSKVTSEKPLEWIKRELKPNPKLVPIKLANLCYYGGVFAFIPYVTLHMKAVGLSNEEIGLIYAVLPWPSIVGPLISGMVADKLKAFKAVFLGNVFFLALFHTLLVMTPQTYRSFRLDCNGSLVVPGNYCGDNNLNSSEVITNLGELTNCKFICGEAEDVKWCPEEGVCEGVNEVIPVTVRRQIDSCGDVRVTAFETENLSPKCEDETCHFRCQLQDDSIYTAKYGKTFTVYIILRVVSMFFTAAAFTMMDAVTMAVLADVGGDFGKQRLMTLISLGVMPLVSSIIVNASPLNSNGEADYGITFYVGDALLLVAFIIMLTMKVKEINEPLGNIWKGLGRLLSRFEIVVFLCVILVLGSNWGFLESFFLLYLKELNAPPYLLGLTMTFGCAIGVPVMIFADRIVEKVGRPNIFIISFVAYSVRMFGYSIITNPWMSFPFEALEVVTYQVMWVAAVTYFPILAPPALLATISGIAGTVHYNFGRGFGSGLGGVLMDPLGSRNTFRLFGIMSIVSGFIYFLLHHFYLRKKIENNSEENEKKAEAVYENPVCVETEKV